MRTIATALAFVMLGSGAGAQTVAAEAQGMEGEWGVSSEECADTEGPNLNMSIRWPTISRYEYHCRRDGMKRDGKSIVVEVACRFSDKPVRGAIRFTLISRDVLAGEFVQGATEMRGGREQHLYQRCRPR